MNHPEAKVDPSTLSRIDGLNKVLFSIDERIRQASSNLSKVIDTIIGPQPEISEPRGDIKPVALTTNDIAEQIERSVSKLENTVNRFI